MTLKELLDKCYFETYIINDADYGCDYNPVVVVKDKELIADKLLCYKVKEISYQEGSEDGIIMIDVYKEYENE